MFQKLIFFAKIAFMRVDKFLNVVNITKRRAISEDMCKSGIVGINGVIVKASKEVKVGDIITLHFIEYTQKYKVLAIPSTKSIPKNAQNEYVVKFMKEFILAKDEIKTMLQIMPKEGVVLLQGDLASGKTSLVQAWVKFLGLDARVDSPTFSTMQKYENHDICIYHYDIYQEGLEGLLANGLFENFFEKGLHLVEWGGENLKKTLMKFGISTIQIKISIKDDKRKYEIYE